MSSKAATKGAASPSSIYKNEEMNITNLSKISAHGIEYI